jgi:Methyltransferase domain
LTQRHTTANPVGHEENSSTPAAGRRARLADRLARAINPGHYIWLEYPPAPENCPRYGHGRPPHPRLQRMLEESEESFTVELDRLMRYRDELAAIPQTTTNPLEPYWDNGFMFGLDAASLYAFLRARAPRRYVEIGSGNSTLFANRARRDGRLYTHMTSIDPFPRRDVDEVCDTVVRAPLQDVDCLTFDGLEAGDVVFFDGTHRVFMNSDVTVFFLDVLPSLPSGVLVGIHDIHLPYDYPPEMSVRYFSEQYMLAAYLLADCPWLRPVLPCRYVAESPRLAEITAPLFAEPNLLNLKEPGVIFWSEIDHGVGPIADLER